jgi:hypothetical protein
LSATNQLVMEGGTLTMMHQWEKESGPGATAYWKIVMACACCKAMHMCFKMGKKSNQQRPSFDTLTMNLQLLFAQSMHDMIVRTGKCHLTFLVG